MKPRQEYLTVTDLAEALQVHDDTVRSMIARGELPGVQLGRRWYVRRAAFEALFAKAERGLSIESLLP